MPLKPLKGDPPGTRNVTFKNVPLGRLRWTYDDNKKWSERPLQQNEYPIHFFDVQIVSSHDKTRCPDVQIYVANRDTIPGCTHNQVLTITVRKEVIDARPSAFWHELIAKLTPIVRAVRIGQTTRPWWKERPLRNQLEASSLAGAHFTTRYDSIDLDDSWQTWTYLL